jgi:uncharacterized protein YqjF (DUF2071 family)
MSAGGNGIFLTGAWRHLVMLNYEVEPALLRPHVPAGTELDAWRGRTFMSVVGFLFRDTRVFGVPVPLHRDFEEVNLRFYVRRETGGESRRAVVFVRELVPRRAIALVARAMYNEPYRALPMRSEIAAGPSPAAHYSWFLGRRWHRIGARTTSPASLPAVGSLEEFITEHYWGYTRQKDGTTIEYRVTHPQWPVAPAAPEVDADFSAVYGADFAGRLGAPVSCFLADGSAVSVHRPGRVMALSTVSQHETPPNS